MPIKSKEKQKSLFETLPFIKRFGHAYNINKPERGLIMEFETENGTHHVKLSRHAVGMMRKTLAEVEQNWQDNDEKIQNGT